MAHSATLFVGHTVLYITLLVLPQSKEDCLLPSHRTGLPSLLCTYSPRFLTAVALRFSWVSRQLAASSPGLAKPPPRPQTERSQGEPARRLLGSPNRFAIYDGPLRGRFAAPPALRCGGGAHYSNMCSQFCSSTTTGNPNQLSLSVYLQLLFLSEVAFAAVYVIVISYFIGFPDFRHSQFFYVLLILSRYCAFLFFQS